MTEVTVYFKSGRIKSFDTEKGWDKDRQLNCAQILEIDQPGIIVIPLESIDFLRVVLK